jgi:hypothetical protein
MEKRSHSPQGHRDRSKDRERESGKGRDEARTHVRNSSVSDKIVPQCLRVPEGRQMMLNVLLHAADISNPAKPFELANKWAKAVLEEFYVQVSACLTSHSSACPRQYLHFASVMITAD